MRIALGLTRVCLAVVLFVFTIAALVGPCAAFQSSLIGFDNSPLRTRTTTSSTQQRSSLFMAQVSEQEAKQAIDKVVNALRKDSSANEELGRLEKVQNVLGYGSPTAGSLAVRFNASFKKGGFGLSSVPLPFGLGQSNKSEGRGQMVG